MNYGLVFLVGIILVLGVLTYRTVDIEELISLLTSITPSVIVSIFLISTIVMLIKCLRFYVLLRELTIPLSLKQTLKVYIAGQVATPLPAGEAFRVLLIQEESDVSTAKSAAVVIVHAYFDMISAVIITITGVFYYPVLLIPVIIVTLFAVFATLVLLSKRVLFKVEAFTVSSKRFHPLVKDIVRAQHYIHDCFFYPGGYIPTGESLLAFLLAIVGKIGGGILLVYILNSFQAMLSIIEGTVIYSSGSLLEALTTPGGIGFTEAGVFGLLSLSGVEASVAIAAILLYRFATIIFYVTLGFLFTVQFYGRSIFRKAKVF